MSLALELLDRRNKEFSAQSQMCDSSNADELCAFLQQEYEDYDDARYDESACTNEFADCYVRRLNDVVKVGRIGYHERPVGPAGPVDSVELNILIEKSLLEYELKLAEKSEVPTADGKNVPGRKKVVFDVERLEEVLKEGEGGDLLLLRHYVELLKLGYAPELANSHRGEQNASENTLMDELVSTLLSLAVQRNIHLPPLDTKSADSMGGRIEWFKECIYKVAGGQGHNGSRNLATAGAESGAGLDDVSSPIGNGDDDDRRALKDLQFAHSYLTKKYEEEVSQHAKSMNNMITKYQQCEDLLKQSNFELSKVSNQLLRLEIQNAELTRKLEAKTKEAHELQMKNNLLRVDNLGMGSATTPPASADSASADSPTSLLSASSSGNPSSNSSVSVRILRMEFKKLVEQMNARFTRELEAEQTETRRLEELLELHKARRES